MPDTLVSLQSPTDLCSTDRRARRVGPKKALHIWGESVEMHMTSAHESADAGMVAAMLLHRLVSKAAFADTQQGKEIQIQAQYIAQHFAQLAASCQNARACFTTLRNGGWQKAD